MIKKKRLIVFIFIAIFLLLILFVGFKICENRMFDNLAYTLRMSNHEDTTIKYKDETLSLKDTEIYSEYSLRFDFSKHSLYFGDFDQGAEHIKINMPDKLNLKVYPNDDNSVLIEYQKKSGVKWRYKLSDYGDFSRHLELLYMITENDIFKEDS